MTDPAAYPSKAVRLMTGAPGGGVDFATRLIARGLTQRLGQNVRVDNLPAGSMAGVLARSAPDGYTLLMTGSILWLGPLLRDDAGYDPVKDVAPIRIAVAAPHVLVVNPSLPVQSVAELLAYARSRPGQLKFTSPGAGSSTHLAGELFKVLADVDVVHQASVGNRAAMAAVAAGDAQFMFSGATSVPRNIESGAVRALAVSTAQRSALFPDLPTVAESGIPDYESSSIMGLFAPAGTPAAIIDRLNRETEAFLKEDATRAELLHECLEMVASGPAHFAAIVKSEMERLGALIADAGIRA